MKNKIKFAFTIVTLVVTLIACEPPSSQTSNGIQEDSTLNDSTAITPSDTTAIEPKPDSATTEKL